MLPIPTDDGVYASFSITLSVAGNMTYASGAIRCPPRRSSTRPSGIPIRCLTQTRLTAGFPKHDKTNSGKYIGTIATTLVSGLSISGEWIQIECRITASPRRTW
jgi:hypothetical protein